MRPNFVVTTAHYCREQQFSREEMLSSDGNVRLCGLMWRERPESEHWQ
jgi:hypothetical protein